MPEWISAQSAPHSTFAPSRQPCPLPPLWVRQAGGVLCTAVAVVRSERRTGKTSTLMGLALILPLVSVGHGMLWQSFSPHTQRENDRNATNESRAGRKCLQLC